MINRELKDALNRVDMVMTEYDLTCGVLVMLIIGLIWSVVGLVVPVIVPTLDQSRYVIPAVFLPLYVGWMSWKVWSKRGAVGVYRRVAEQVEARFPELQARLLSCVAAEAGSGESAAAVAPSAADASLREVLNHNATHDWTLVVPVTRRRLIKLLAGILVVGLIGLQTLHRSPTPPRKAGQVASAPRPSLRAEGGQATSRGDLGLTATQSSAAVVCSSPDDPGHCRCIFSPGEIWLAGWVDRVPIPRPASALGS